jgi:hypothetical protein
MPGLYSADADQISNAMSDNPSLSGSRACQDQKWALAVKHRFSLLGIEMF